MTDVTLEQRSALAKFLGCSHIYHSSDPGLHDSGMTTGWRVVDGPAHLHRSDADLMLALLNRAAEFGCQVKLKKPGYRAYFRWVAEMDHYKWDGVGRRLKTAIGDTPLEAVVLAVLQLPEARP